MSASELTQCSKCSRGFYAYHGNQTLCSSCKAARKPAQWWQVEAYGKRECARCRREFQPLSANQKFCSRRCKELVRAPEIRRRYIVSSHRRSRQIVAPAVASGLVRCARGSHCKYAEWLDGVLLGGFIQVGQLWDMGHADSESPGGPEHRSCNRAAPSRLRAKRKARG